MLYGDGEVSQLVGFLQWFRRLTSLLQGMWLTQTQALERTWSISHMTCDEEQHSTGRWKMPVKFLLVLFPKWQHWKGFFFISLRYSSVIFGPIFFNEKKLFCLSCPVLSSCTCSVSRYPKICSKITNKPWYHNAFFNRVLVLRQISEEQFSESVE